MKIDMSIVFGLGLGFLILIGFYFFKKWNMRPVEWEHEDVARLLDSWIKGKVDYKTWDYFEASKIANPKLEVIRLQAIEATYLDSPYIESCGQPGEVLNEKGKELFKELRAQCIGAAI